MSTPVQPELTGFVFCFGLVWGVLATLFWVYVAWRAVLAHESLARSQARIAAAAQRVADALAGKAAEVAGPPGSELEHVREAFRAGAASRSVPVAPAPKRFLGVVFVGTGTVVEGVRPGSPAEKAGLRGGDRITRINGHPVATNGEVRACIEQVPENEEVTLVVSRGSELQEVKARLEKGAVSSPLPDR